jgi:hypothetical protein
MARSALLMRTRLSSSIRACAILGACVGYDMSSCLGKLSHATDSQVACVLDASVAECTAANACIGVRVVPVSSCTGTPHCLDSSTYAICQSSTMRLEADCPTYIDTSGPACITGTDGQGGCAVSTCSSEGEYTCDGSVSKQCFSGRLRAADCASYGMECVPSHPGCTGVASGPCTTGGGCDGGELVDCQQGIERRTDCGKTLPGGTCIVVVNNLVSCGLGEECSVTQSTGTCIGTTLRACASGVVKDIDCTRVGATTCSVGPNGAQCAL